MEKEYELQIQECTTETELFNLWKSKPPKKTTYIENKQSIEFEVNHRNGFIRDGVVNLNVWEKQDKRIAFLLKEAYGDNSEWDLKEMLRVKSPWSSIWRRVAEWTYGIQNTTVDKIAKYEPEKISMEENNMLLNQIAVFNLKKSGGEPQSNPNEIKAYANADRIEIKRQLELINPDIVVCGNTMSALNQIYDCSIKTESSHNDNWYYFTNVIGGKKRLVLDYYHPANYYPALLNYYGLVNIYHQALIADSIP